MVLMHANSREEIEEAFAGDIVAFVGLKDTRTGDTLCDPLKPVILERMEFPAPVIEMAVEADLQGRSGEARRRAVEARRRGSVLQRLDRPGVRPDDHQGDGRAPPRHQDRYPSKRAPYNINVTVGAPQVAYRETIRKAAEIDYTHKKQTGGTGQFARVKFAIEPNEAGRGLRVREQGHRRLGPEGIRPRRREGPEVGHGFRTGRRLPRSSTSRCS